MLGIDQLVSDHQPAVYIVSLTTTYHYQPLLSASKPYQPIVTEPFFPAANQETMFFTPLRLVDHLYPQFTKRKVIGRPLSTYFHEWLKQQKSPHIKLD